MIPNHPSNRYALNSKYSGYQKTCPQMRTTLA